MRLLLYQKMQYGYISNIVLNLPPLHKWSLHTNKWLPLKQLISNLATALFFSCVVSEKPLQYTQGDLEKDKGDYSSLFLM